MKPDFITPETSRRIKGMSMPELTRYLQSMYNAGYLAGYRAGIDAACKQVEAIIQRAEGSGQPPN